MAIVNVDLSEYDMLREAKRKAEEQVQELKKEIEGLKDKSRVIIITKKQIPSLNASEIIQNTLDRTRYGFRVDWPNALEAALRECYHDALNFEKFQAVEESSQYVDFDDVRIKIETDLKAQCQSEINSAISKAEQAKKDYEQKRANLKEELQKLFEFELHEKDNTIQDVLAKTEKMLEEKEESIKHLTKQLNISTKDLTAKDEIITDLYAKIDSLTNYSAQAKSFELKSIRLENELSEVKHELEVERTKKKRKWFKLNG